VFAALAYPTVVLTVALGVCIVYWLFVFLGALDVNLLGAGEGAHDGAFEGAAKGATEGLAGAAKGAVHQALGASKGAAHTHGHDIDGSGLLATIFSRKAPVTVSLSVHLALAWLVSVLGAPLLAHLGLSGLVARAAETTLLLGALLVTLPIASLLVAPLAPFFALRKASSHRDLVGRVCTITTGTVDAQFGQAHLKDGGAGLLLHVRNDGATLKRGDEALIVAWDESRESFLVEPMAAVLGREPPPSRIASVSAEAVGDGESVQETAGRERREK
jgi:hypothetical protein